MAEPIIDASVYVKKGPPRRKRKVIDDQGVEKVIVDRVPPSVPNAEGVKRYVLNLDEFGHDLNMAITTMASDLDTDGKYARGKIRKWRRHGVFPFGQCPAALLLQPSHGFRLSAFLSADLAAGTATPCRPGTYSDNNPCPHAREEKRLRMAADAAIDKLRVASQDDAAVKQGKEIAKGLVEAAQALAGAPHEVKAKK